MPDLDTVSRKGKPQIVEHANIAPKRCALTRSSKGPFLDTGMDVRRYGRVYLALRAIDEAFYKRGWLPEDEVVKRTEKAERATLAAAEETEDAENFRELVKLIGPLLPTVDPVERQVVVTEVREPTQDDIEVFLKRNPGFLDAYRPAVAGSKEEWQNLYGQGQGQARTSPTPTVEEDGADGTGQTGIDLVAGPPPVVELHEQSVDLDSVLENNAPDVVAWLKDKPAYVHEAIAEREIWRADATDRDPRVSVLRAAGRDV